MKTITVTENNPIRLDDCYIESISKILLENPTQPFRLENNQLIFNEYIIGSFQVDDLKIEVLSRHGLFSLSSIFEMILYTTIDGFEKKMDLFDYGSDTTFGISQVTMSFCDLCEKFIKIGLNGNFQTKIESTKYIKGKIDFRSFNSKMMLINGLDIKYPYFSYNNIENKIIKSSLKKIKSSSKDIDNSKISKLLKEFDMVNDYDFNIGQLNSFKYSQKLLNPYYPIVLEFAIIILKELNLYYKKGNLNWYSFLINSNTIFEKYIFKIIKEGLSEKVTKWDKGISYGDIKYKTYEGRKKFIPDILIDYDKSKMTCRSVVDVKNKKLNIDTRNLGDTVISNDLYQMTFYCSQLKTNCGSLIYPSNNSYQPLKISLNDSNNTRIFILSLNMNKSLDERHTELLDSLKENVLVYT